MSTFLKFKAIFSIISNKKVNLLRLFVFEIHFIVLLILDLICPCQNHDNAFAFLLAFFANIHVHHEFLAYFSRLLFAYELFPMLLCVDFEILQVLHYFQDR